MPVVKFTPALKRFFPGLNDVSCNAATAKEVMAAIECVYPGICSYLLDDQGAVRKHVHVFVGEDMIEDRQNLSDTISASDVVHIIQALSGG